MFTARNDEVKYAEGWPGSEPHPKYEVLILLAGPYCLAPKSTHTRGRIDMLLKYSRPLEIYRTFILRGRASCSRSSCRAARTWCWTQQRNTELSPLFNVSMHVCVRSLVTHGEESRSSPLFNHFRFCIMCTSRHQLFTYRCITQVPHDFGGEGMIVQNVNGMYKCCSYLDRASFGPPASHAVHQQTARSVF